jgi:hypothetical protein
MPTQAVLVQAAVEDGAGLVVGGVVGGDQPAVEGGAKPRHRNGGLHKAAPLRTRAKAVVLLVEGP